MDFHNSAPADSSIIPAFDSPVSGGGLSHNGKFSFGYASFRGKRSSMEDFYETRIDGVDGEIVGLFGVFDGHGGARAAEYVKQHLFSNLIKHPKFISDIKLAIGFNLSITHMAEDLCDTKLSLAIGGGYHSPATKTCHHRELKPAVRLHLWFPACRNEEEEDEVEKTASVDSKNLETHKAKQKDGEHDGNHSMRKKLCLTKDQSTLLEVSFCFNSSLTAMQKQELAQKLALSPRQVEVWFQNRRARTKLKQIEVDYEALKRWCMNLTNENKTLKRALREVKVEAMGDCHSCEKKARVLQLDS